MHELQLVTGLGLMRLTTAGPHAGEYLPRLYRMQTVIVQRPVALTTPEAEDADGTTSDASLSIESLATNGSDNLLMPVAVWL